MADTKISGLTTATTPLAGTEVLPIVQSSTTKQVSVANLTAGRTVTVDSLNITSGSLNLAGGGANGFISGNTWYGINTGNWVFQAGNGTQSFIWDNSSGTTQVTLASNTGNVTLNTGNLVQGTAAKGFNFTANTAAAGMTSQLLNWYEEGTFTPTLAFGGSGTGITYTTQTGYYTRIGRQVTLQIRIVLSSKGSATGGATVGGLPYNAGTGNYPAAIIDPSADFASLVTGGATFVVISSDTLYFMQQSTTGRTQMTQANFGNTADFRFAITYNV